MEASLSRLTFWIVLVDWVPPVLVSGHHLATKKYTAISRKVVGKKVHSTMPKGNMGYDQYTVPDTVAVEPAFVAFL